MSLDALILGWFNAWRCPLLGFLFGMVSWLGSLWVLLPLSLTACWWRGRRWLAVPSALLLASLSAYWLKDLVGRARPGLYEAIGGLPANPSMPSSHAAQAAAGALAVILLLPAGQRRRAAGRLLPLVGGVALSRLYLQVHWPSDVLAGLLLGGLCTLAAHAAGAWAAARNQPSSLR